MMEQKDIRNMRRDSLLRETVATFLQEITEEGLFISLADMRPQGKGRTFIAYCSVFPETEQERTFKFLQRKEHACRDYLKEKTALRDIPFIRFKPVGALPFEAKEKEE